MNEKEIKKKIATLTYFHNPLSTGNGSTRIAKYTCNPPLYNKYKNVIVKCYNFGNCYKSVLYENDSKTGMLLDIGAKRDYFAFFLMNMLNMDCAPKIIKEFDMEFNHVLPLVKLGYDIKLSEEQKNSPWKFATEMAIGDIK